MARGYWQLEGVDCDKNFAPTVRFGSVRDLVAHGASMVWELDHMDVATAFLYAELEEEIPEGVGPVEGDGRPWRLKTCLYGLK